MRHVITLLMFGALLASTQPVSAQQIQVTYYTETKPITLPGGSTHHTSPKLVEILEANPSGAVFYLDSIIENTNLSSKNVMSFRIDKTIYTDLKRKYMYKTSPQMLNVVARDTLIAPQWVISEHLKFILGYPCKEAVLAQPDSQDITVWFTTALPLPYGPYGTYGLPGLILRYETGDMATTAVNVDIQPNQPPISMPQASEYITFDTFFEKSTALLYSKISN
jgi:GLPGLI family protein